MQRRPLIRLHDRFGRATAPTIKLPSPLVRAPESLYRYDSLLQVADAVGLSGVPAEKVVLSPWMDGQPKTGFLQTGWMTDAKRQTAFEIGDNKTILSLHFRRNAYKDATSPWHLDVLEIDDGRRDQGDPVPCHIPCDEAEYGAQVTAIFRNVRGVVGLMALDDWRGAQECFHDNLAPVIRLLDSVSEIMAADHEFEFREKFGEVQPQRGLRL